MSTSPDWGQVPEFTKADRIRKARESAGLSQQEMADRIGIARSSITNYEKGHHAPLPTILKQLAMATGVPLAWMETGEGGDNDGPGAGDTQGYLEPLRSLTLLAA